ncbi:MAG: L-rhamnose mutarotase [Bacteroidales bacterium]|nr:L-rhamnose mutarotase [Bacteroidales bacterium]
MNTTTPQGYPVKRFGTDTKRYVRTLTLRNEAVIDEYRTRHAKGNIWQEIIDGLKEVGVLEMEIYIRGTELVMIVETPADFDWDSAMSRLAVLPRQQEWEDYMSQLQDAKAGASSTEKWLPMERMFYFYD